MVSDCEELHDLFSCMEEDHDSQLYRVHQSVNEEEHLPQDAQDKFKNEVYIKKVITHISLFDHISVMLPVSECGISILQALLKLLLSWLSSLCLESLSVKLLAENMPINVYYLKKLVGGQNNITTFVSCPKCYSVYKSRIALYKEMDSVSH